MTAAPVPPGHLDPAGDPTVAVRVAGMVAHLDGMSPEQAADMPRRTRALMRALLEEALRVLADAERLAEHTAPHLPADPPDRR